MDTIEPRPADLDDIPVDSLRKTIQNAGGGYVNHDFFFKCMSPNGGGEPGEALEAVLKKGFGSVAAFKKAFTLAALEVFGSGWAWLVWNMSAAKLEVKKTANQDTPAMQAGMFPLLGLDVWEHAYYLKHQSRRAGYIEDFWAVVNWAQVEDNFEAAAKASVKGKAEL